MGRQPAGNLDHAFVSGFGVFSASVRSHLLFAGQVGGGGSAESDPAGRWGDILMTSVRAAKDWVPQTQIDFLPFWKVGVQDQGVSKVDFCRGLSPLLADSLLLSPSVCVHICVLIC